MRYVKIKVRRGSTSAHNAALGLARLNASRNTSPRILRGNPYIVSREQHRRRLPRSQSSMWKSNKLTGILTMS